MRIELKFAGDIPIIKLSGRFIAGGDGPFLRQKVSDLIEAGSRKLILDFGEVPYLDSTGLGFLAGSQKVAQLSGATIILADLNQHVKKVLETAQMTPHFVIAVDEADALEKLKSIPEEPQAPEESSDTPSPAKSPRGKKRGSATKSPEE